MHHWKRYLAPAALVALAVLSACTGPATSTLNVVTTGSGAGAVRSEPAGIDCGTTCHASFAFGSTVTLIATPAAESRFMRWSGCDSAHGLICSVSMTGDRSVFASFAVDDASTASISGTLVFPGDVVGPSEARSATASSDARAGSQRGVDVVPGEVIVRYAAHVTRRLAPLHVAGVPLAHVRSVAAEALEVYRAEGLSQAETLDLVAALRGRDEIEDAFPNWIVRSFATPADEFYAFQWHYGAANLPAAWDIEDGTSAPVIVAIIDTGIIPHPDLDPLPGFDFFADDDDPTDTGEGTDYHGSHVAGTVAAVTNNALGVAGVSWGADIVPVRVLGPDGSGSTLGLIDGIIWAAGNPQGESGLPPNPNPARIINLSLGGNIGGACPESLDFTFGQLVASGAILIAAAGNDGTDAGTVFPANCSNVIAVGATGPADTRAPYSNYGSVIDIMAPGGDTSTTLTIEGRTVPAGVLSTTLNSVGEPDYAFFQGTSMAAPHVAGLAALMLAADPSLTPELVRSRLRESARGLDAAACGRPSSADCGAGLIDAAAALVADTGAPVPPPALPPVTTDVPTYVVAFYCLPFGGDPCGDFDFDRTAELIVSTDSHRVPYSVTGLAPGTYLMAAWQDLDQDLVVDEGEPFGAHPDLITLAAGDARTGVTIYLEPLTMTSTPLDDMVIAGFQERFATRGTHGR